MHYCGDVLQDPDTERAGEGLMLASVEPACQTILYQLPSHVNSNCHGSFVSRTRGKEFRGQTKLMRKQRVAKLELRFL